MPMDEALRYKRARVPIRTAEGVIDGAKAKLELMRRGDGVLVLEAKIGKYGKDESFMTMFFANRRFDKFVKKYNLSAVITKVRRGNNEGG